MISERYQVTGISVESGEKLLGWYHEISKGSWLNPIENGSYISTFKTLKNGEMILTGMFEVNPGTIESVRVVPTIREIYNNSPFIPGQTKLLGTFPYCPNCDKLLDELGKPRYCPGCGMALDWSE